MLGAGDGGGWRGRAGNVEIRRGGEGDMECELGDGLGFIVTS